MKPSCPLHPTSSRETSRPMAKPSFHMCIESVSDFTFVLTTSHQTEGFLLQEGIQPKPCPGRKKNSAGLSHRLSRIRPNAGRSLAFTRSNFCHRRAFFGE